MACKICGCEKEKILWGKKICSVECVKKQKVITDRAYREKYDKDLKARKKQQYNIGKKRTCVVCRKTFERASWVKTIICSRKCFYKKSSQDRVGTGSPAYRNGLYTKTQLQKTKVKTITRIHLTATRSYRERFIEKHGYQFCEHCKINQSLRFEVHHIIFASEKPQHINLHNDRNLIHICIECHNKFHSAGGKEMRKYLVEKRNLAELFGDDIL